MRESHHEEDIEGTLQIKKNPDVLYLQTAILDFGYKSNKLNHNFDVGNMNLFLCLKQKGSDSKMIFMCRTFKIFQQGFFLRQKLAFYFWFPVDIGINEFNFLRLRP